MLKAGRALALEISKNSPRAVQGTKICLNYAENHSTADALNQVSSFFFFDILVERCFERFCLN